jgi:hypothetical protein
MVWKSQSLSPLFHFLPEQLQLGRRAGRRECLGSRIESLDLELSFAAFRDQKERADKSRMWGLLDPASVPFADERTVRRIEPISGAVAPRRPS